MNINLIKFVSFFIGLFITLVILSYYKIIEPFTDDQPKIKEEGKKENFDVIVVDNQSVLPFEGYKFICINTYLDITKISLNDGKWYDNNSENKYYDFNYNNYFKFNKGIKLYDNNLNNNGAKLADLRNIQLDGPACFNFANNSETYELIEFSMFLVTKITNFTNNHNIIFEMTGNTVTTNNVIPTYTSSIINVDFIVNDNFNYNINIHIGDVVYSGLIDDIDKDIIHNPNYIILGMYYTAAKIGFIINQRLYEYANTNTNRITLGSTPLIINKYGSANMQLLNFVYYKTLFHFDNFDLFVRYNNYYISGLYYESLNKKCDVNHRIVNDDDYQLDDISGVDQTIELPDTQLRPYHLEYNNLNKLPSFKYDLMMDRIPSIFNRFFNYSFI